MKTRKRNNHVNLNQTAWDLGLCICWKVKAPVWCFKSYKVNGVRWK